MLHLLHLQAEVAAAAEKGEVLSTVSQDVRPFTHHSCCVLVTFSVTLQAEVAAAAEKGEVLSTVSQDVRLDNRALDLRTPANQAIFKLQSAVCQVQISWLSKFVLLEYVAIKVCSTGAVVEVVSKAVDRRVPGVLNTIA
jgi:aspartyl/asparaginyl-tRNA synthetase